MSEGYYSYGKNDGLSFREIILTHYKNILKLSFSHNYSFHHFSIYRDAILTLRDALVPHFDEKMVEANDSFEKEYQAIKEENSYDNGLLSDPNTYRRKLKPCLSKLFTELGLLLNRKDYLKSQMHSEAIEEALDEPIDLD